MPWKSTRLKLFGVPIRRRTAYVVTLAAAILSVASITWAMVNLYGGSTTPTQITYLVIAALIVGAMLNGCRVIIQHNLVLYREEARFIWPGALVALITAMLLTWLEGRKFATRAYLHITVPTVLGGVLFIYFLVQWCKVGSTPKRPERGQGASSRRGSTPPIILARGEFAEGEADKD